MTVMTKSNKRDVKKSTNPVTVAEVEKVVELTPEPVILQAKKRRKSSKK